MKSCQKAATLASEQRDRPLSFGERIHLGFHMALCRVCRVYVKQLAIICQLSRRAGNAVMDTGPCLPPDAKQRIKDELERK